MAVGGGFELALACDLIVATTGPNLVCLNRLLGLWLSVAGFTDSRQIGLKQAMGLVLSGDSVDATRAFELGLLTDLVAPEELENCVERWCSKILRCAPLAVRASKKR